MSENLLNSSDLGNLSSPGDRSVTNTRSISRDILTAAKSEAENILSQAGEIAGREFNKARADGLAAGKEELSKLLLVTRAIRAQARTTADRELLELVLSIAEEVIQTELSVNPQSILKRIRNALKTIAAADEVVIVVNPKDLEFAKSSLTELRHENRFSSQISVSQDDTITPGDARLVAGKQSVESSVSAHLGAIRLHLLGSQR